jgi:hypothetical protein
MNWIVRNIKWIMIVSGVLTSSMIYAAIAPQEALTSTFGAALKGPLAEIIVRNWGADCPDGWDVDLWGFQSAESSVDSDHRWYQQIDLHRLGAQLRSAVHQRAGGTGYRH